MSSQSSNNPIFPTAKLGTKPDLMWDLLNDMNQDIGVGRNCAGGVSKIFLYTTARIHVSIQIEIYFPLLIEE